MVPARHLKNGAIKSCGCLLREATSKRRYKHGESNGRLVTRLYIIWTNMKRRCFYPKDINFHRYGGRGITVCPEWRNNYSLFRFWAILNGYQNNLTIDRINNDGNYEPDNCQWLTKPENSRKGRLGWRSGGR